MLLVLLLVLLWAVSLTRGCSDQDCIIMSCVLPPMNECSYVASGFFSIEDRITAGLLQASVVFCCSSCPFSFAVKLFWLLGLPKVMIYACFVLRPMNLYEPSSLWIPLLGNCFPNSMLKRWILLLVILGDSFPISASQLELLCWLITPRLTICVLLSTFPLLVIWQSLYRQTSVDTAT